MKMLQLQGDFVPRPHTGAPPLDPVGGLPSPSAPDGVSQVNSWTVSCALRAGCLVEK